jgi:hypothetical protein
MIGSMIKMVCTMKMPYLKFGRSVHFILFHILCPILCVCVCVCVRVRVHVVNRAI